MKYFFWFAIFQAFAFQVYSQPISNYRHEVLKDHSINWAGEYESLVNLTPKPGAQSLKKWYLQKLATSFVNDYDFDSAGNLVGTHKIKKDLERPDWLNGYAVRAGDDLRNWFFENKQTQSWIHVIPSLENDSCCGCDESDAFRVKQILFYKNGRFNLKDIFLSPLCARRKDESTAAWYPLGNFAFTSYTQKSKTAGWINTSNVKYPIDPDGMNRSPILLAGDKSLSALLLDDISAGKLQAFDPDTKSSISYKKLLTWKMAADTVMNMNDSGEVAGYTVVQREWQPSDLGALNISVKWYFDFKKEQLFSEIESVMLMRKIFSGDGTYLGLAPFCTIRTTHDN